MGGYAPSERSQIMGKRQSTIEWAEEQRRDPRYRDDIEAMLTEIDVEQDLIGLRMEREITQVELAERVGLSQPSIARLESGKVKNVELKTLVKIAAALGTRVKITFEKYDHTATKSAVPAKSKRTKKTAAA